MLVMTTTPETKKKKDPMTPQVIEMRLPDVNHRALLYDLSHIAAAGLHGQATSEGVPPEMNTEAVSVFLGEVVKKHLPDDIRCALAQIEEPQEGKPPYILRISNLPLSSELGIAPHYVSEYVLRGMAALIAQDHEKPVRMGQRYGLVNGCISYIVANNSAQSYHRDMLHPKDAKARPYPNVEARWLCLLCEEGKTGMDTFFVDAHNEKFNYGQATLPADTDSGALAVTLKRGDLVIWDNNRLLHGRCDTPEKETNQVPPRWINRATVIPRAQTYDASKLPPMRGGDMAMLPKVLEAASRELEKQKATRGR
jgi:hypothetical protein